MSEELLSNERLVEKHFTRPGFEPHTSQSITRCTDHSAIRPLFMLYCNRLYNSNKLYFGVRATEISQMQNESLKKSLEKSKNVLEKRKMAKRKICIKKTNTFTITAMNFVQEQLITFNYSDILSLGLIALN